MTLIFFHRNAYLAVSLGSLASAGLALLVLTACVAGHGEPTPERLQCLQGCAGAKDRCILDARNAAAVQQCDEGNQTCTDGCRR